MVTSLDLRRCRCRFRRGETPDAWRLVVGDLFIMSPPPPPGVELRVDEMDDFGDEDPLGEADRTGFRVSRPKRAVWVVTPDVLRETPNTDASSPSETERSSDEYESCEKCSIIGTDTALDKFTLVQGHCGRQGRQCWTNVCPSTHARAVMLRQTRAYINIKKRTVEAHLGAQTTCR